MERLMKPRFSEEAGLCVLRVIAMAVTMALQSIIRLQEVRACHNQRNQGGGVSVVTTLHSDDL